MLQADFEKLKELSQKYAEAKQEYKEAKKTGTSEEILNKLRKERDNARKRFQGRLTL